MGLILGLRPANERRRYLVTTSLIGWMLTWNQPCLHTCVTARADRRWKTLVCEMIVLFKIYLMTERSSRQFTSLIRFGLLKYSVIEYHPKIYWFKRTVCHQVSPLFARLRYCLIFMWKIICIFITIKIYLDRASFVFVFIGKDKYLSLFQTCSIEYCS